MNIRELVIENVFILGFLMADTSTKQQKLYILGEICHIFTLYRAKIMFMHFIISRKKPFLVVSYGSRTLAINFHYTG